MMMDKPNQAMTPTDRFSADSPAVSVIIPTFHRNELLEKCLRSCIEQRHTFALPYEIVAVDNSANAGATPVVDAMRASSDVPIRLVHQPSPGISNARNAGIAAAKAPYLAWIDDDESASENWLNSLWTAAQEKKADIVFGSVIPMFEDSEINDTSQIVRPFLKNSGATGDRTDKHFTTSNCLMKKEICKGIDEPFSLKRNFSGGEDHLFFMEARNRGVTFGWDIDSVVYETIPRERSTWAFVLLRSFRKHQIMVQNFFDVRPRRLGMVLRCMVVGGGQFVVFGTLGGLLWLARSRKAEPIIHRSMIGLGKLIWFQPFQAEPYGRSR